MKSNNIIWGFILIAVGIIFGLNALDITDINIFFDGWWTLFIIVPCLLGLVKGKEFAGNLIGLLIGVVLLLMCNDIVSFDLISKLLLPVILITLGILLLSKDFLRNNIKNKIKSIEVSNDNEFYAIFGSNSIKPKQEEVNGASLNAIFGELKCDLRDSKITKDIVINATSVFGGMTIIVPEDVNIITTATPLFGGVENKVKSKNSTNTIYIKGTVLFGGIEINERDK